MTNLSQYQKEYLANRAIKIAQIKAQIEQENYEKKNRFANSLYADFSQANSKQLKRISSSVAPDTMPRIYNWLNTYSQKR